MIPFHSLHEQNGATEPQFVAFATKAKSVILAPHGRTASPLLTSTSGFFAYPFYCLEQKELFLSAAIAARLETNGRPHTVVISCRKVVGEYRFHVWCGDGYLDGVTSSKIPTPSHRLGFLHPRLTSAHYIKAADMAGAYSAEPSARCNFYSAWNSGGVCKHVATLFSKVRIGDITKQLIDAYDQLADHSPRSSPSIPAPLPIIDHFTHTLQKWSFKSHVRITGPRGTGKTFAAERMARSLDAKHFLLSGHEGVTTSTMLGNLLRLDTGRLVWQDGKVSEAFRYAASGGKAILQIDEVNRIGTEQTSVLLSAASPDTDGFYTLTTSRAINEVDGIAQIETLRAPVDRLWIITTANMGARYSVHATDPAFQDRFIDLELPMSRELFIPIVSSSLTAKGFSVRIADGCWHLFETTQQLAMNGLLLDSPSLRAFTRSITHAETPTDILDLLKDHALLLVDRDSAGAPLDEQLRAFTDALESSLSHLV